MPPTTKSGGTWTHARTGYSQVYGSDDHYSSGKIVVSSVVSDEYQEEEHPRDMHGKWTSGDQTESPAFKSWFGESKLVDEHGKPLVVYHGTRHEF